ncbi:MAG: hypothetical protein FWG30_01510 [Eubacteriaceae bacterium]|jgi:hypothetical protein|nr:hypothetical protein [Eubacteriaceae bacterium]
MNKRSIGLAIGIIALLLAGCQAFTAHEKAYSALVGSWELDSVYVNARPVSYNKTRIAFSKDGKGTIIEQIVTKEETVNDDGEVISPAETDASTTTFQVSNTNADDGKIVLTMQDGTVERYDFSVDKPAGTMHLLANTDDGGVKHFIYVDAAIASSTSR